jgi:hypothetical protein
MICLVAHSLPFIGWDFYQTTMDSATGLRLSIDPSEAYMIKYQIAAINNY